MTALLNNLCTSRSSAVTIILAALAATVPRGANGQGQEWLGGGIRRLPPIEQPSAPEMPPAVRYGPVAWDPYNPLRARSRQTTDAHPVSAIAQPEELLPPQQVVEPPSIDEGDAWEESNNDYPLARGEANAWWQGLVGQQMRPDSQPIPVSVGTLTLSALEHSLKVQAIKQSVRVAFEDIIRAEADFDVEQFIESKFIDTSDPVGNSLVVGGGGTRLNEADWQFEAGLRKRTWLGGQWSLAQQLGHKDSNSQFFVPKNQGNSRLTLNFTQPLLNGSGRAYNEGLVILAQVDTRIAEDQYASDLQDHLLDVTDAYWQLFHDRGLLLQKQRHLERAQEILRELDGRAEIDAVGSQIARARAAVASRAAELVRARAAVKNVESRLRSLINAPILAPHANTELLPEEMPFAGRIDIPLSEAIQTALANRPEIDEASQRVKAAAVELQMSARDLLPTLNFIVETYVSGLQGDSGIGPSLQRQFDTGAPSYTAGLLFETPIYRRAAKAKHRQDHAKERQATLEFEEAVQSITAEVEIALRDAESAYEETQAKLEAMIATVADVRYLRERWELLPGDDRSASLFLEDILNAQERLMDEEASFLRSQVDYARAIAALKRATGTLMGVQVDPHAAVAPNILPVNAPIDNEEVHATHVHHQRNAPRFRLPPLRNVSLQRLPPVSD